MILTGKLPASADELQEELCVYKQRATGPRDLAKKRALIAIPSHATNGTIVRERRGGGSIANHSGA